MEQKRGRRNKNFKKWGKLDQGVGALKKGRGDGVGGAGGSWNPLTNYVIIICISIKAFGLEGTLIQSQVALQCILPDCAFRKEYSGVMWLTPLSRNIISNPLSFAYPSIHLGSWARAKYSCIPKNFPPYLLTSIAMLLMSSLPHKPANKGKPKGRIKAINFKVAQR